MIDARLLPLQRVILERPARIIAATRMSADMLSVIGFLVGVAAFGALVTGQWTIALALIVANRVCDGLDGAVARINGATKRGAFIDIAFDFVFYALVPLGFALHDPAANALAAAILITGFVGTGSSFLAFSVIAAKLGKEASSFPAKGIYYVGGLAEGFETIGFFIAMCLFPGSFPVLAMIFAAICLVTTLVRWYQGWVEFSEQ